MRNISLPYFLYQSRYQSYAEKRLSFFNGLKGRLLAFIAKNKKLAAKLDIWESYTLSKNPWIKKYDIFQDEILNNDGIYYDKVFLNKIVFFEVIEIDNFDSFRKKAISKFGNSKDYMGIDRSEDLKKTLSEVENKFDNISWGSLFHVNFKRNKTHSNDLIDSIDCRYIKTHESYFIISFTVRLSDKSSNIFKQIIQQADVGLSVPHYNSFLTIIKKRRFYSYESFIPSLKSYSIRNLVSDINCQVKNNVTRHFNGYFHKSKVFKILPCIELYEVDNIYEFKKDKYFQQNFIHGFHKYYSLEDEQIEIHSSDSYEWKIRSK